MILSRDVMFNEVSMLYTKSKQLLRKMSSQLEEPNLVEFSL